MVLTKMSLGDRGTLPERPLSVEEVVKLADEHTFDPHYNLQHYFRTASLMVKQANIYQHEGNDQMAYFLLYRHARLILSQLPKHPQAKDSQFKKQWTDARKDVNTSLAKLEVLKPRLTKRHQAYVERRKALAAKKEIQAKKDQSLSESTLEESLSDLSLDPKPSGHGTDRRSASPTRLDPMQHQDLAVEQANQEIQRRIGKLRKRSITKKPGGESPEDSMSLVDVRRQLDRSEANGHPPRTSSYSSDSNLQLAYPSIPTAHNGTRESHGVQNERQLPSFVSIKQQPHFQPPPPQPPPKEPAYLQSPLHSQPARPPKELPQSAASDYADSSPKLSHQFTASARLESGESLRTIFLPSPLRHRFLDIAEPNTAARLETCGMLCGTLVRNAFFITKLVIPEQTSTTDTCEMVNEAALYSYIDAQPEDLMVLGWIHTHPTQTCFMSSRDLHTHVWYQVQLPESIAIVCSPTKDPDWGVFRLTHPPGLDAIKKCSKPGIFHPHEETHIFTDVLGRPGHVIEHKDLKFEVVDLRP